MSATSKDVKLPRLFQSLLLADIVLSVLLACLTMQFDSQLQAAIAAESTAAPPSPALSVPASPRLLDVAALVLVFVMAATQLVSWVGLFWHRNWARWLYLGLLLGERGLQLPFGAYSYGLDWHFLDGLSQLRYQCCGTLLVTVFFTSVTARFQPETVVG